MKYRLLTEHYKLPHINNLSKIHKNSILLRSIVSHRGSVCYPLSRFLVKIGTPLTGKSSSYVNNSAHFGEKIPKAPILSNQNVSLDIFLSFKVFGQLPLSLLLYSNVLADMSSGLLQEFVELGGLHGTSNHVLHLIHRFACSDSVNHNRVQVLRISVLLLASSPTGHIA